MLFMKMKASALVLAVVGLALSGGLLTHRLLAAKRSPEASTADAAPREKARAGAGKGVVVAGGAPRRAGKARPAQPEKVPKESSKGGGRRGQAGEASRVEGA
jgi:hypothetical protein